MWFSLFGICFIPLVIYFTQIEGITIRESIAVKAIALYFFISISSLLLSKSLKKVRLDFIILTLSFYILLCILSFIFVVNTPRYLKFLPLALCGPMTFIISYFFINKKCTSIVLLSTIASFSVSVIGIMQYFGILPHWYKAVGKNLIPDPSSTFTESNGAVLYLVTNIPIMFLSSLATSKKILRFLFTTAYISSVLYCTFSGVRAGYLTLFVISIVLLIFLFKNRSLIKGYMYMHIFALSPLIIIILFLTAPRISDRFLSSFNEHSVFFSSARFRIETWKSTLDMILSRSYGAGIGGFAVLIEKYKNLNLDQIKTYVGFTLESPHNEFLLIMAETGILGFVLFLIIVSYSMKNGIKFLLMSKDTKESMSISSFLLGVIAHLICIAFSFHEYEPGTKVPFWLFLSMLASKDLNENLKIAKKKNIDGKIFFIGLSIVSIFLLLATFRNFFETLTMDKARAFYGRSVNQNLPHNLRSIYFDKAEKEFTKFPEGFLSLAKIYAHMGKINKSIYYFTEYLKMYPYDGDARIYFAITLFNGGFQNKGLEQLQLAYNTEKAKRAKISAIKSSMYAEIGLCRESKKSMDEITSELKILNTEFMKDLSYQILPLISRTKNLCNF